MSNPVVRWQIISPQPDATVDFYRRLFGWTIDDKNALGYREVISGGINGGVWPAPPNAGPFVQLFVESDDVTATATQASELGATVLVPVSTLPDGDMMAVLRDPVGLAFGVCSLVRK